MDGKLTLGAAGDIVVCRRLFDGNGPLHPGYERTLNYLREADLVWGACEVQFSQRGYRTDAPIGYLVDPVVAEDLGRAGFGIMTVATNHTCDYGPDAFLDTLAHLNAAGIDTVGGGPDLERALEPWIGVVNGCRLGILAVCCLVPPDYAATDQRPGIAPLRIEQWPEINPVMLATEPGAPMTMRSRVCPEDLDRLCRQVTALRSSVDALIVSVHWGYGRGFPQAEYQGPLGRAIIDAGADMVLGNHPHSPAGIETYQGRPILYSLGNHIAQHDWDNTNADRQKIFSQIDPWSVVCRIELGRGGVSSIAFRATECDRDGVPNLIEEPMTAMPVLERFQQLSGTMGTTLAIDGLSAVARF